MDISRDWASCRALFPVFSARPVCRMYSAAMAVMPVTCGAAMEVPDMFSYACPPGTLPLTE